MEELKKEIKLDNGETLPLNEKGEIELEKMLEKAKQEHKKFDFKLNDNEIDFTDITEGQFNQLFVRYNTSIIQLLTQIMLNGCETQLILMEIAKKQGIDVVELLNKR